MSNYVPCLARYDHSSINRPDNSSHVLFLVSAAKPVIALKADLSSAISRLKHAATRDGSTPRIGKDAVSITESDISQFVSTNSSFLFI
jgi:hypothetical protein